MGWLHPRLQRILLSVYILDEKLAVLHCISLLSSLQKISGEEYYKYCVTVSAFWDVLKALFWYSTHLSTTIW